jgi:hypothetical protein
MVRSPSIFALRKGGRGCVICLDELLGCATHVFKPHLARASGDEEVLNATQGWPTITTDMSCWSRLLIGRDLIGESLKRYEIS